MSRWKCMTLIVTVAGQNLFRPSLTRRYLRSFAKILSLDELHYYDLYTSHGKQHGSTPTSSTADGPGCGCTRLGERYGNIVREGPGSRWIDVYPNRGKSGGAFSSGTYNSNPYHDQFHGDAGQCSTIAHEMGHSMRTPGTCNHTQPPHYAEYTLVAEVISDGQ